MGAERLAAYSDGVVAIIVTIMVLDLRPPVNGNIGSLVKLWPVFSAYVLSFLTVSIYWMNHHHLLHANRRIGREVMWFNVLWLFCLSLFPFTTAFVSGTRGSALSVFLYAVVGSLAGFAFLLLGVSLSRRNADVEIVGRIASQRQRKNLSALALNVAAAFLAFVWVPLALFCLALPAIAYFLPDRRVETG